MKIDIDVQCQSTDIITDLEKNFVGFLKSNKGHKVANLSIRIGCLIIAGAMTIFSLAKLVTSIAEPIFKGMIHIIGSLFSKKIKAESGFICLGVALMHTLHSLPNLLMLPISFIFNTYTVATNSNATNGLPIPALLIEPKRVMV